MDQIMNMLISIKNAGAVRKGETVIPHSKMKLAILEVLKEAGYIKAANVVEKDNVKKEIKIALEYTGKVSKVNGVKRLSKLGGRQYMSTKDIYKVRNGFGLLVLSTPKGIMSGAQARKENVGGEALFEIW